MLGDRGGRLPGSATHRARPAAPPRPAPRPAPGRTLARQARAIAAGCVALFAGGCLDDRGVAEPTRGPGRLALAVRLAAPVAGLQDGAIHVRLTYARRVPPAGSLGNAVLPLPAGAGPGTTVAQPLEVDLAPCLADPQHAPGGNSCTVTAHVTLVAGEQLLDETTVGPFVLQPGGTTPQATVELHQVAVVDVAVPPAARLYPGGTLALVGRVLDSRGGVVPGRDIAWSSAAPGVATVSAAGVVTGVAPGAATVRAASGGRAAEAVVRVWPRPVVRVAATAGFTVARASPLPAPISLVVDNAVEGVLTDLAAGPVAYEQAADGWLSATLSAATAPTTLVLRILRTNLQEGEYSAVVRLSAPDAPAVAAVRVTFIIADRVSARVGHPSPVAESGGVTTPRLAAPARSSAAAAAAAGR